MYAHRLIFFTIFQQKIGVTKILEIETPNINRNKIYLLCGSFHITAQSKEHSYSIKSDETSYLH